MPCLPQRRNEKKAECGTYQNLYWVSCKRDDAGLSNSGLAGLSIITTDYVCTIARYGTWQKEGAFEAAADLAAAGKAYEAAGATLEQQHRNMNLSE